MNIDKKRLTESIQALIKSLGRVAPSKRLPPRTGWGYGKVAKGKKVSNGK
jgi:hypothetical protein